MVNFLGCYGNTEDGFVFDGFLLAADDAENIIYDDMIMDTNRNISVLISKPFKEPKQIDMTLSGVEWTKRIFAESLSEILRIEWNARRDSFAISEYQDFSLFSADKNEDGVWVLNIVVDEIIKPASVWSDAQIEVMKKRIASGKVKPAVAPRKRPK